jgi:hypothetical protein
MNETTNIKALETSLKETQDLIDTIHRKYKKFPDVEHSNTVAALVHLVGKSFVELASLGYPFLPPRFNH